MTRDNIHQGKQCGNPVIEQQWGLKFNASEVIGLEAEVKKETGKDLAGIGVFTIDGMLWEEDKEKPRLWYKPLCDLNKDYKVPCLGECCTKEHFESKEAVEILQ